VLTNNNADNNAAGIREGLNDLYEYLKALAANMFPWIGVIN